MFVWAIADRALDLIGLGTVIYWTVKATKWAVRPKQTKPHEPKAWRL